VWLHAPVAVLSFITTLHLAAVLLLSHRRAGPGRRLLLLPSSSFALLVWVLPDQAWLLAGLAAQVTWVVACERLLPVEATVSDPASKPAEASPAARPAAGGARKKPAAAAGFVPVKVLAVVDETPEIRTFRMERPEGFEFRPGQFLMVRVAAEGKDEVRCYSISSSPEATGYLEISVRKQGRASGAIHETIRAGGVLPIRGPGGSFVYPLEPDVPLVLHAGGVGVTPMISMLRHAVKTEPGRPVTFLYTVRAEQDVAFRDELAVLARRAPGVRVYVTLSRGEPKPGFLTGRMDAEKIARYVPDPAKAIHLICGPGPMIESLQVGLASLGVPADRIRFEAFEAAVATASETVDDGGTYKVSFSQFGGATTVSGGTSLLDAAEAAGAPVDSMCRAGTCGTCRTRLVAGKVEGEGKALKPKDRESGWVLTCVSYPRSDCTLDV
jgi:ferredoxin-NADP reductase